MCIHERLGTPPVTFACLSACTGQTPVNLAKLLSPAVPATPTDLCRHVTTALGQARNFAHGLYRVLGFPARATWTFWAPIMARSGEECGVGITIEIHPDTLRYVLCFHDAPLYADLILCLLRAELTGHTPGRYLGLPQMDDEVSGGPIIRFEVEVPRSSHAIAIQALTPAL